MNAINKHFCTSVSLKWGHLDLKTIQSFQSTEAKHWVFFIWQFTGVGPVMGYTFNVEHYRFLSLFQSNILFK